MTESSYVDTTIGSFCLCLAGEISLLSFDILTHERFTGGTNNPEGAFYGEIFGEAFTVEKFVVKGLFYFPLVALPVFSFSSVSSVIVPIGEYVRRLKTTVIRGDLPESCFLELAILCVLGD